MDLTVGTLKQSEIKIINDLIAEGIRIYFTQKFFANLPNTQTPALGPATNTAGHVPVFSGALGTILQDIINAFLTDDGTTVSLTTDTARQLFLRADQLAKLQSNFQNAQIDAAIGKRDVFSINGVTIAEIFASGLDMHGNPIINAAIPVSYVHSFMTMGFN